MIPQSISLSIDWDNACLQFQGWDGNVYSTVVYKQNTTRNGIKGVNSVFGRTNKIPQCTRLVVDLLEYLGEILKIASWRFF